MRLRCEKQPLVLYYCVCCVAWVWNWHTKIDSSALQRAQHWLSSQINFSEIQHSPCFDPSGTPSPPYYMVAHFWWQYMLKNKREGRCAPPQKWKANPVSGEVKAVTGKPVSKQKGGQDLDYLSKCFEIVMALKEIMLRQLAKYSLFLRLLWIIRRIH